MNDLRTVGWRLFAREGMTPSARRRWQLLAAILPAVFPLLVVVVGLGLGLALARMSGTSSQERIGSWLVVMVPLALWLLAVSVLARRGAYLRVPLAIPLGVLVPVALGLLLLTRLPHLPQLLEAAPRSGLIGFMVVRVVGAVFLIAWASGEVARPWFNLEAGGLDVFMGVTALPVAWLVSTGAPAGVAIAVVWNLIGLLDFVMAIAISRIVANTAPGYMLSLRGPMMQALKPTISGIVTFAVPLAIMIHALSLWQLLAT